MASSFSSPLAPARSVLLPGLLLPAARRSVGLGALMVVGVVLASAMLLAPEQPVDQAAICERHNGAQACRVW